MKKSKIALLSAFTVLFALSSGQALALNSDSIYSEHIAEADGTSGQDTSIGNGVKTAHIQDGAVTDAKISGPISAAKIAFTGLNSDTVDGVHASELAPAVHGHSISDINSLDATLASKADQASVNAALAGKSDVGHNHDATYQPFYNNVIIVSMDGKGDFTDPKVAMDSITDASATNPYLIKIMPGTYVVPVASFYVKDYVDIEGSGRSVTEITSVSQHQGHPISTIYYNNVSHAELRDLTISISTNYRGAFDFGISVNNGSPRITDVDIKVNSNQGYGEGGVWNGGLYIGRFSAASPVLTNVDIEVLGPQPTNFLDRTAAIYSENGSSPLLKNVTTHVQDGYYMSSFNLYDTASITGVGVQYNDTVSNSGSGTFTCIFCYDENYVPIP